MRALLLMSALPLVLVGACATTREPIPVTVVAESPADTAYGKFLAGDGALRDGRNAEAADLFSAARFQDIEEPALAERAFTSALLAGDIARAAVLAPAGEKTSDATRRLGKLVVAVEALATGQGEEARALLTAEGAGLPHRAAIAMLTPWAAAGAGDVEASLVRPVAPGDKVVEYFGLVDQAFLYERAKRFEEAETDFKLVTAGEVGGEMPVIAYGGFLERRGRRQEAVALYDRMLARDPTSAAVKAARERAAAGRAPPAAPSVRQGAAQSLLAPAASMLAQQQIQLALAYLRLSLRLDPERNEAWVLVGDILEMSGDSEGARRAYGRPRPGSPEYAGAQAKLAWTYENDDNNAEAMRIARAAAASGDFESRVTLADLLRKNDQFAEAAEVLTGLIKDSKTPDWRLLYARGVSLERSDRWNEAEGDFVEALKLRPDEPELLNYLGYTWISRGERLPEALAMVEKAVGANPRSGAMMDSLGWAHYQMKDFKTAVPILENAVELDAGDPEINDHLGDAYWRVGRHDEAMFQWRRVLTLAPDEKLKAKVTAKVEAGGLDGPPAKIAGT